MMLFEWILYFIITGIACIMCHEAAHQHRLRGYGRKAEIYWEKGCLVIGRHEEYEGLTNRQLYSIYSEGVYAGIAPIIFACILFHPIFILILLPYLGWSWHDIKNMKRTR